MHNFFALYDCFFIPINIIISKKILFMYIFLYKIKEVKLKWVSQLILEVLFTKNSEFVNYFLRIII